MAIISKVGKGSFKGRVLGGVIVAALTLGAVTMVYPFLLMMAGSTKSAVDQKDLVIVPKYLRDDVALYRKHIEGLFNESPVAMNIAYDADVPSFERVDPPSAPDEKLADEWAHFLELSDLPGHCYALGYMETMASKTLPLSLRKFKRYVAERVGSDINAVNRELGTEFGSWFSFMVAPDNYINRAMVPADNGQTRSLWEFKKTQPDGLKYFASVEGAYKKEFLKSRYTADIAAYNRLHGTSYGSYGDVHLSRYVPEREGLERDDWEKYVRNTLNPLWIGLDDSAMLIYARFLKARFKGDVGQMNASYGTAGECFEDVRFLPAKPLYGAHLQDRAAFITGWTDESGEVYQAPLKSLRVESVEFMFRDWLKEKYGSAEKMNAALGTAFAGFINVLPPQRDSHYLYFQKNIQEIKKEFTCRNFLAVIDYMVLHGRGIINTVIYCGLTVLFALIVNPMAAYALSRYRLPTTYKILLFLMLTMAFPPIITQIPMFLMLKDLRLLNTFAALILPGIANGYSIFLLKGFFDSLPRELYECAELDGAGEWTMFWHITMKLSTPVLAVIALQAFTLAYGNFMFALLICQDQKMWTLMVWLYQLRQFSGEGVVYASLLIAAVPTFLIFVFCQKIIMRGIVVPSEK